MPNNDYITRENVIRGLECCMRENNTNMCGDCPYHDSSETRFGCMQSAMRDALALLRERETMPSYNDAVDTIKFQSKVMAFACQKLAEYESEEPCNTLFYIKEQRQKCDERCCNDKTPDEWCWRRYISLMVTEDSPTPDQMRDTK